MAETYGTQCCFVSLLEAPASLLAVIWHDISRPPAAVHARTAPWSTFPGRWKTLLGLVFLQNVHNRRHCQCVTACCSLAFPLSLSLSFFLSFLSSNTHILHFFSEALWLSTADEWVIWIFSFLSQHFRQNYSKLSFSRYQKVVTIVIVIESRNP